MAEVGNPPTSPSGARGHTGGFRSRTRTFLTCSLVSIFAFVVVWLLTMVGTGVTPPYDDPIGEIREYWEAAAGS